MGTPYFDVYKRAVTEFKDPTLKNLFETDTVLFCEIMYNFLENAISMFTNPLGAKKRVNDRISPVLYENSFVGDGTTFQFVLTNFPTTEQYDNSVFRYTVGGESVTGTFDQTTNTVTLTQIPADASVIELDSYYVGEWNVTLYDMESYLVSQFLLAAWSQYIQNDKLDIIRLLGDTDFKLTAVSSATSAKSNWNIVNKETVQKEMTKYSWDAAMEGIYP